MTVNLDLDVVLKAVQASALDHGLANIAHSLRFPGDLRADDYSTGTTDNKQDLIWSDRRTVTAAPDSLDVRGGLPDALGGTLAFVEIRGILIINRATAAASVLSVGGGSNPAFAGLFGATGDIVKVPASGCLLWTAPLDGGGLATTAGTADILTVDPGAATITYDICIWGVSA